MDDSKEPPRKKSKRFAAATSDEQMEKPRKGFVPKNTTKSTNWAVRVLEQWRVERNLAASGNDRGRRSFAEEVANSDDAVSCKTKCK